MSGVPSVGEPNWTSSGSILLLLVSRCSRGGEAKEEEEEEATSCRLVARHQMERTQDGDDNLLSKVIRLLRRILFLDKFMVAMVVWPQNSYELTVRIVKILDRLAKGQSDQCVR